MKSDPGEMAAAANYAFRGRLKSEFPSQVVVDITEVCNLACTHCPHPAFKLSEHYRADFLPPELNAKMVDEVREQGPGLTQYIRYTSNGEPLVHPKGYEMIDYATRNSGVFVTLTTNGTTMNEKRMRRLLESGVHMIDISIDALTPETYAKVRVGGDLETTRSNVLSLIDWVRTAKSRTKVVVSYIEQPLNAHETPGFEKFWNDHGADQVVVRRLHSAAGAVVKIADIMRKKNAMQARRPCLYPWERISLDARGFLAFCPTDWSYGSTLVDFRDATIKETWQGKAYRELREAHLTNDFSAHGFCGQCPDWQVTRWPGEGLSYADMIEKLQDSG